MAETGNTFRLEVITPDAAVLSEDVEFLRVRALDGDLGIMPNHAPLIASLGIDVLAYVKDGVRRHLTVAKGFLEVNHNTVTIITPAAEKPGNIDVERAKAAEQRAEERLQAHKENLDVTRAEAALQRALHRIDAAEKYGNEK